MNSQIVYTLTFNELLYLCALNKGVSKIYGFNPKLMPDGDVAKIYENARNSLIGLSYIKEVVQQDNASPGFELTKHLADCIMAVCHPKTLVILDPCVQESIPGAKCPPLHRFYMLGGFAVDIQNDIYKNNSFYVKRYEYAYELNEAFENCLPETIEHDSDIIIGAEFDEQQTYDIVNSITSGHLNTAMSIMESGGIEKKYAVDICQSIRSGKRIFSLVILAFDKLYAGKDGNEGKRRAKETILYQGDQFIWEISMFDKKGLIRKADMNDLNKDFSALASIVSFI